MAPLTLHTWLDGTPPSDDPMEEVTAVVIDVLRATSTIATALAHGAAYVDARADVADAFATRASLEREGEKPVLGGERESHKVPGFDLGNSPLEYTPARVSGRPIVLCTSNGTAALVRCRGAGRVFAAGFVNAAATVAALVKSAAPVTLCCAGEGGAPSLEDACCAGLIATLLLAAQPYEADDATAIACLCWRAHKKDVARLLRTCRHGRQLHNLGFGEDLTLCSRIDAFALPVRRGEGGKLFASPAGATA